MDHLQSLRLREVRIWVKFVLTLTSRKIEIARSATGPRSQGLRAEDVLQGRLRAQNLADLVTADHNLLSEGCQSRNNHRHAVVVRDLVTQWVQSCPCKTKELAKVLGSREEARSHLQ